LGVALDPKRTWGENRQKAKQEMALKSVWRKKQGQRGGGGGFFYPNERVPGFRKSPGCQPFDLRLTRRTLGGGPKVIVRQSNTINEKKKRGGEVENQNEQGFLPFKLWETWGARPLASRHKCWAFIGPWGGCTRNHEGLGNQKPIREKAKTEKCEKIPGKRLGTSSLKVEKTAKNSYVLHTPVMTCKNTLCGFRDRWA